MPSPTRSKSLPGSHQSIHDDLQIASEDEEPGQPDRPLTPSKSMESASHHSTRSQGKPQQGRPANGIETKGFEIKRSRSITPKSSKSKKDVKKGSAKKAPVKVTCECKKCKSKGSNAGKKGGKVQAPKCGEDKKSNVPVRKVGSDNANRNYPKAHGCASHSSRNSSVSGKDSKTSGERKGCDVKDCKNKSRAHVCCHKNSSGCKGSQGKGKPAQQEKKSKWCKKSGSKDGNESNKKKKKKKKKCVIL